MFSTLPTALALLLTFAAPHDLPVDALKDAQPLARADAIEFLLALDPTGPGIVDVDVIEVHDAFVATVTRVARVHGTEKVVMLRTTYLFPSTIYAHSSASNGFHAEEMD